MSNPFSKLSSAQLPGDLYQTAIDTLHLAVETRNENGSVFSIINHVDGELVAQIRSEKITPWHSLIGIDEDLLLLQYFENKKNPDIISFNTLNWKTEQFGSHNGETQSATLGIPFIIRDETEEFSTIKQFIGSELVLGCEYLELDELILISYYKNGVGGFDRSLVGIYAGTVALEILQDSNLKGFAPGSFFTYQNRLIFAKEKNEINIYEI